MLHKLYRSIKRLLSLPQKTRLFMCHDYKAPGRDTFAWETTVGEQRENNVHVKESVSEHEFVTMREARYTTVGVASSLMNACAAEGIRLDIKVDHTPASINVALPIGLIVNELMTSAFKYAFVDGPGGTITLHCLRQDGPERYCVMVGDDGVGLPEGGRWSVLGKIGALIVQALHENTKTDMMAETEWNRGVRVTLTFGHKLPLAVETI